MTEECLTRGRCEAVTACLVVPAAQTEKSFVGKPFQRQAKLVWKQGGHVYALMACSTLRVEYVGRSPSNFGGLILTFCLSGAALGMLCRFAASPREEVALQSQPKRLRPMSPYLERARPQRKC